jgi:hypothetical protein
MRLHMNEDSLNAWYNCDNFITDEEIITGLIDPQEQQEEDDISNTINRVSHQDPRKKMASKNLLKINI